MKKTPLCFTRRLKAFDKNLRARWSYERRKWVIEGKAKDARGLQPPVKFTTVPGGYQETTLPELSDRYIGYHDGYYPILYAMKLDERIFSELHRMNKARFRNREELLRARTEQEDIEKLKRQRSLADRSAYEAGEIYDYVQNRGSQAFPDKDAI